MRDKPEAERGEFAGRAAGVTLLEDADGPRVRDLDTA